MNYILECLQQTKTEERRKEAERLLNIFSHPARTEIPHGCYNASTPEIAEKAYAQDNKFFQELAEVFGESPPELFARLKERFNRNYQQSLKLSNMRESEKWRIPAHELFPFFDDFHTTINNASIAWSDCDLSQIEFAPNLISRGGFADIHKVKDKRGNNYALKLLRPGWAMSEWRWNQKNPFTQYLLWNIKDKHGLFSQKPLISPRAVTDFNYMTSWYLMDFFEGENIQTKIDRDEKITQNRELTRIILTAYAEMLKMLHSQGMIFMDNNWGAVLVNSNEAAICDYDFVSYVDKTKKRSGIAGIGAYLSLEQICHEFPNFNSELESFALMIDALFFKPNYDYADRAYYKDLVKSKKREYSSQKACQLPKNLRQVVAPLIKQPRDDSITIENIINAIKEDFKY